MTTYENLAVFIKGVTPSITHTNCGSSAQVKLHRLTLFLFSELAKTQTTL